jgi:hypothetical protein
MTLERRDIAPGRVFLFTRRTEARGYVIETHHALVVIDRHQEIDFWTGARWRLGDVMAGCRFSVLC